MTVAPFWERFQPDRQNTLLITDRGLSGDAHRAGYLYVAFGDAVFFVQANGDMLNTGIRWEDLGG